MIRTLAQSPGGAHGEALKEHILLLGLGTMPIWLFGLVQKLWSDVSNNASNALGFVEAVWFSLSTGSLFLLSTSMLGPVAYLAFAKKSPHYVKPFPSGGWHVVGLLLVALLASACCSVLYLSGASSSAPAWAVWLSVLLFCLAVFLSYSASVFDSMRTDPRSVGAEQDSKFVDDYSEHRRARRK